MSDKFLIDECLSVSLVRVALARSMQAHHVVHLGLSGQQDWSIAEVAIHQDYTLVTNNGKDFLKIYKDEPLHCGLIIIVPQVRALQQAHMFDVALDEYISREGLLNRHMIVGMDGYVHVYEQPDY